MKLVRVKSVCLDTLLLLGSLHWRRGQKMEKNVLLKFDCFSDPATISPQWKRWLTSFELYADGKGLIISEGATAAT